MNAGKNNPNTGGHGASKEIHPITTKNVSVESNPSHQPVQKKHGGPTFHSEQPAGSEAQPHPKNSPISDVRIAG